MAAASALQQNAITTYQDIVAATGMTIVAFFPTSGNIVSRDAIWAFDNTSSYDGFTSCRISISLSRSKPGILVSTIARPFKLLHALLSAHSIPDRSPPCLVSVFARPFPPDRRLAHILQLFSVVPSVDRPAVAILKKIQQKIPISSGNFGASIAPTPPQAGLYLQRATRREPMKRAPWLLVTLILILGVSSLPASADTFFSNFGTNNN